MASTTGHRATLAIRSRSRLGQTICRGFHASYKQCEASVEIEQSKPAPLSRREAALQHADGLPFEQLPYQAFQHAMQIIEADRNTKAKKVEELRGRIARLKEQSPIDIRRKQKINALNRELERTKILADINHPGVKKTFEDGKGDLNKPIYRYLAEQKWKTIPTGRKTMMQRLLQMNIVPDLLPEIDLTVKTQLWFQRKTIPPGAFVDSRISFIPPRMVIQPFDAGERLVTIAVVDPDVPDIANDSFKNHCNFLAVNVPVSHQPTEVNLGSLTDTIHSWHPPTSQKGLPYRRNSIFILPQDGAVDPSKIQQDFARDGFSLRRYMTKMRTKPVGAHLFRTVWDDGTVEVMRKLGLSGADKEFRPVVRTPGKNPEARV